MAHLILDGLNDLGMTVAYLMDGIAVEIQVTLPINPFKIATPTALQRRKTRRREGLMQEATSVLL